jgi:hypothetical protein
MKPFVWHLDPPLKDRTQEWYEARLAAERGMVLDLEHQLWALKREQSAELEYHRQMAIAYRTEGNELRAARDELKVRVTEWELTAVREGLICRGDIE